MFRSILSFEEQNFDLKFAAPADFGIWQSLKGRTYMFSNDSDKRTVRKNIITNFLKKSV
jgi:hypothetical protein